MGFWNNLSNIFRTNLTNQERETIWQLFGSFDSNKLVLKGNSLIENSYERNIDVYSIIKKIVDVSKSVPWVIEQQLGNGEWKLIKDSTLHELMDKPNETKGYTWNDIEEQILVYLMLTGNSYLLGERPFASSLIQEVDVLPSSFVEIKSNYDFFLPELKYDFCLDRSRRTFTKEDLSHIKFFNPGYCSVEEAQYGLSLIRVAAQAVQAGNDRWDASVNIFQHRGAIGLITDKSNRPMTPEEADKVETSFKQRNGGTRNYGKIKVTNKDLNYIQMAMSPQDLQLLENGIVNTRAICNVFGLDSSLFNDPANKTYNNQSEAQKALYTNAIMPLSDKVAEHLTRFLCANHFPGKKVRMRQDFSKIECLQENFKEKADTLTNMKKAGIYTANEVRIKMGDEKSNDPLADVLNTQNVNNFSNESNA